MYSYVWRHSTSDAVEDACFRHAVEQHKALQRLCDRLDAARDARRIAESTARQHKLSEARQVGERRGGGRIVKHESSQRERRQPGHVLHARQAVRGKETGIEL